MNRVFLICIAFAALTTPALAGGETLSRVVDRTSLETVAPCRGGRIVEQVYSHGNVYGGGSQLILVCLRDNNSTADWVLISGSSCYDANEGKKCHSGNALSVPRFSEDRSPATVRYNLIKYALGKRCRVFRQKFTISSPRVAPQPVEETKWVCDENDVYDGTMRGGKMITNPKQFRTIFVETTSRHGMTLVDGESLPAETFMIERAYYHYEVE